MVVFGKNANVIRNFQKVNEDTLISVVKGAQILTGTPNLVNALETTKQLFFEASGGVRPDSRKIVVVMIDRKSGNTGSNIEHIADEFEDGKVKFVTVVIGDEADLNELTPLTPDKDKDDIVQTDKDDDPPKVGIQIWAVMALGKYVFLIDKA